jgi:hypothetical protein
VLALINKQRQKQWDVVGANDAFCCFLIAFNDQQARPMKQERREASCLHAISGSRSLTKPDHHSGALSLSGLILGQLTYEKLSD